MEKFIESKQCTSRFHCKLCLSSEKFREDVIKKFEWDGVCPLSEEDQKKALNGELKGERISAMNGETKINPMVYKVDDPRIDKLSSGEMTLQEFLKSITAKDPFRLVNNELVVMTEDEIDHQINMYYKSRMKALKNTGGMTGKVFYDNKDVFLQVYPEFTKQVNTITQQIEKNDCTGCAMNKYTNQILIDLLKFEYDGRDLSPLTFLSEKGISRLKGEEVVITTDDIPLPPFLQKEKPVWKEEEPVDNPMGEVREACMDCVKKHLSQAAILLGEVKQGYDKKDSGEDYIHKWMAIGHLSEAADEALAERPDISARIRKLRLKIMGQQ